MLFRSDTVQRREYQFKSSKWFSRIRTLQELLAPAHVVFLSAQWSILGSKHSLAPLIEARTHIDQDVLTLKKPLESVTIARRMFWAGERDATREEDVAYWLMGLFSVKLQPMYGEGRLAFLRLQEEILKHSPGDQTIFAWGHLLDPSPPNDTRFGESPVLSNTSSILTSRFVSADVPSYTLRYLLASSPKDFKQWSSRLTCLAPGAFARQIGRAHV